MKGRFQSAIEDKIRKEIESKLASVAAGTARDYAEYRYWVGYLEAMNSCLELCGEIEREQEG